jgi:hypothetical protein
MEFYKANNFLQIAKKADSYYKEHPKSEEKATYDFDWFVRFFEAAGNVSDDAMQNLWAKILAGEIARPTTYSLKTIDVLRNLSKKDAELFVKICSHAFVLDATNYFIPNEDEYLNAVDIHYTDIMKLSELGLMFNDGTISLIIDIDNEPFALLANNNLIMLISSNSGAPRKDSIGQYPFTEVGKELSTLISESASDEDFLEYGRLLSQNKAHKISIHRVIKQEGDSVKYDDTDLLLSETSLAE